MKRPLLALLLRRRSCFVTVVTVVSGERIYLGHLCGHFLLITKRRRIGRQCE